MRHEQKYTIGGKRHDEIFRSVLDASERSEHKALAADLAGFEAKYEKQDLEDPDIRKQAAIDLHELQMKHWERETLAKQQADADLRTARDRWREANEKPAPDRLYELEVAKAKVASMSDKALKDAILGDVSTEFLLAAAQRAERSADADLRVTVSGRMQDQHVDAPWLNDGEVMAAAEAAEAAGQEYGLVTLADHGLGAMACEVGSLVKI